MLVYRPCGTKQMSWLSDLSATGSAKSRARAAHLALGHGAQREHQGGKLGARGGKEEVALVALAVAGPVELGSGGTGPQLDIVPGGERLGVELLRRGQQLAELDLLVAGDTRNRRLAGNVAVGEGLHDRRLEALLVVEDVVGDAELVGHPARVVNVLAGAAGPAPPHGLAVVVELQGDADDVVPLLLEQGSRHRRIDAAGHGDDHAPRTCRTPALAVKRLDGTGHGGASG